MPLYNPVSPAQRYCDECNTVITLPKKSPDPYLCARCYDLEESNSSDDF